MFKKIASIALAAAMMTSTAAIAASAAETDEAVAAAEETVGAAEETVGAAEGEAVGAGNVINFEVNSSLWKNFKTIYCYLYDRKDGEIITWGSRKGAMEDNGDGTWSFDLDAKGISFQSGHQYGCIFTADWNAQTCDLIVGSACIGDTAYCTGDKVENSVDSNKQSYYVKWKNADATKYAPPLCITSTGKVIGEAIWEGETKYSLLVTFIKDPGKAGLDNAIKYNGKTQQETLDEIAEKFGLGQDDIEKAIKESGRTDIKWEKSSSSAQSGGTSGGSDNSSNNTSSNSNSNSGNTSSGSTTSGGSSSSSSSSSSGTGSVSSGEGETMILLFGGVMLAAAGVIFLMRKRRVD